MALNDAQLAFIRDNPFVGIATTLRADGSPHSTVVWVDADKDGISFNTALGRVKPNNLLRDPRISLAVVDPENAFRWVSVTGTTTLVAEGAEDQIDRLAKKYTGADRYAWRQEGEIRVTVRIAPNRVDGMGLDG